MLSVDRLLASAARPGRLATALRSRKDVRQQFMYLLLSVGLFMALNAARTCVGRADGRMLQSETKTGKGNNTLIETDSDGIQIETDAFVDSPQHWYTSTPVLDALFFDPRAVWWSWVLASIISPTFFVSMSCCLKSQCGGDSKWVRLIDGQGLAQLSISMYSQGLWLRSYRDNLTLTLVINVVLNCFLSGVFGRLLALLKAEPSHTRLVDQEAKTISASNVYQNIHFSFVQVLAVFILQVAFAFLYIQSILNGDIRNVHEKFYYGAVLLSIPISMSTLNTSDVTEGVWARMRKWAREGRVYEPPTSAGADGVSYATVASEEGDPTSARGVKVSVLEIGLRMTMGTIVNQAGPTIIISTLPLFLSLSEDPMDFVLNSMAINFIVELDNLTDSIDISVQ